ncbi:uncharacterized protein [Primulina eburnea]|uniref:uncharacterized protein n=1 Tax=Primulina eburnea TaxID=1245227 RepID=UPI003C6C1E0A
MASSITGEGGRDVIHHTKLVSTIDISPGDVQQAQKVKKPCSRFNVLNGELYRRFFHGPLLKCLAGEETQYVLKEIHEGCCMDHLGAKALTRKALLAGYWWPTMSTEARKIVQSCEGCQCHGNLCHIHASPLHTVRASCPFDQWGLDIVGPFPVN